MNKKILVGCPTSDHKAYCLEPYIKARRPPESDELFPEHFSRKK